MAGVELKGKDIVNRNMQAMVDRINNAQFAFKTIQAQALADILKHFKDEEGPRGKWKPSKRVEERGGKTLQDTGKLRGGLIGSYTGSEAIIENAVEYGSYHQDGTGDMNRPFMWISDKAIDLMTSTLLRFIMIGK